MKNNSYRYGLFYFNRNDNRLFVPKKNKILGWTVNFAHKKALIIFVLLFIFVLYVMFKKK